MLSTVTPAPNITQLSHWHIFLHYSWVANRREAIINFSGFLGPPLVRLAKDSITNCTLYCPWVRILLGRLCYYYVWEIVWSKAFLHPIFFIFSHSQQKRLFDTSLIYVYPTEIVRYFHKLLLCYSETLSVDCYILEAPFSLNPLIEFLKNY